MSAREVSLRRVLNFMELVALGYSDVSSTYYFSLGVIALYSGSSLPVTMMLGSIPLWVAGLTYSELAKVSPEVGGAYYYVNLGLGRFGGFIAGWLLGFDQILMMAYGALGFANYLLTALIGLNHGGFIITLTSLAIIWFLAILNIIGIKLSARLNLVLVMIDIIGILILTTAGFYRLMHMHESINAVSLSIAPVGLAYALRGYIGIDVIAQAAGEAMEPSRNVPKSIVTICTLSTVVAILVSTLAVYTGGVKVMMMHPEDPLSALAVNLIGFNALSIYISVSIALVMLLSVNSGIVDFSRGLYRMSIDRLLHKSISSVHSRFKTPFASIIVASITSSLFVIPNDVELIVGSYGIASLVAYTLALLSLIRLRDKSPLMVIGLMALITAILLTLIFKPYYAIPVSLWFAIGLILLAMTSKRLRLIKLTPHRPHE
ncbi:APC family permease [Caldivirga maquilingensis]|uniref:Amino acid permease-associated region n=1 Tax=Caldivirga maquilingensis (strain ATCC 700844 / DSM 13496 / JCM 10307 / IC-167) TaxID=397948 RepID=A8M997_CALMQ|nr:APC family permease [Caldivirga maquilingensis]ABW02316.1 amino acid permease-associated region [Caldivirga maquilingensis IC-167]